MLATATPLQEKMALFWHGHFANNEEKVRDYRKMKRQLELFHAKGAGNFRDLLIGAAQDPAMLAFLDAGSNVKGAPNENFAREIMELFTMGVASNGVANYSETGIREAARAFTGWNPISTTLQALWASGFSTRPRWRAGRRGSLSRLRCLGEIRVDPSNRRSNSRSTNPPATEICQTICYIINSLSCIFYGGYRPK